ncbi:MAG: phosphoribosylglycinamide formyltransferase [Bacteroidota bacterium]|nr:phosphoribosylglycinamide formyltransferase [Bacteroidota bacterium]
MNICVFASGAGTNFQAILDSINKGYLNSKVSLLITNNSTCGAVDIAKKNSIDHLHISRKIFPGLPDNKYSEMLLTSLKKYEIDFIVLAGYMKMLETVVLNKYKNKIINTHPALLPSFGGKGMFGINVHKAAIASGVKVSGITIHLVDENYDEGKIIFQKCCDVDFDDDEFSLQKKIQKMEHKYYPEIIKKFEEEKVEILNGKVKVN